MPKTIVAYCNTCNQTLVILEESFMYETGARLECGYMTHPCFNNGHDVRIDEK